MLRSTCLIALLLCVPGAAPADEKPESPRNTRTVKLIKRCLPACVAIRTYRPGSKMGTHVLTVGAGSVIHADGFVLTNDHVVRNAVRCDVTTSDGKSHRSQGSTCLSR